MNVVVVDTQISIFQHNINSSQPPAGDELSCRVFVSIRYPGIAPRYRWFYLCWGDDGGSCQREQRVVLSQLAVVVRKSDK